MYNIIYKAWIYTWAIKRNKKNKNQLGRIGCKQGWATKTKKTKKLKGVCPSTPA